MTDHLPECVCYTKGHAHKCALCICDRLRACEQRLRREGRFTPDDYDLGYAAGVQAARDAVEGEWTVDPSWDGTNWNNALACTLAAIDALTANADTTPDDGARRQGQS